MTVNVICEGDIIADGGDVELEMPVANDDFAITDQNVPVVIYVLANDTMPAGEY